MSVRELEERCNRERAALQSTASLIREKLSPGHMLDRLLDAGKNGSDSLSKLGDTLAHNPLLASAAGTGAAWFLFAKRKVRQTANAVAKGVEAAEARPDVAAGYEETGVDYARDRASTIAERIEKKAAGVTNDAAIGMGAVKDKAAEDVVAVEAAAGSAVDAEETGFGRAVAFIRNEPFVLLGAGLALGAALGAYAPTTEMENDAIGKASDAFLKEARAAVDEKIDDAKEAGGRLYDAIKSDVKSEVANIAGEPSPELSA